MSETTMQPTPMSLPRRVWLILEMSALYIAAPVILYELLITYRVNLLIALAPVLPVLILLISLDPSFSWRRILLRGFSFSQFAQILLLFAVIGGAAAWYMATYQPNAFLRFPTQAPELFKRIMLFYVLVSVPVQELFYRVLFFHRYAPALGHGGLAIVVSAAMFGFGHFFFKEPEIAMAACFLGGLVLGYRYHRTRSFWAVALEHSLYGVLIFAIGLGQYFYVRANPFPA